MGWAHGSQVLDEVWAEVVEFIPKKQIDEVAKRVVDVFLNNDADTISGESEYAVLRKVARELLGSSDEEDQEDEEE